MKKLPLILSVVSILAVGLILILDLTEKEEKNEVKGGEVISNNSTGEIAYVVIDSIIFKFDLYFELRDELMKKQQSSEAELNSKGSVYEAGAKDYEDKVRKGLVTRATAAQMEQALLQQQQDIVNLRDELQYALMEEEQVMNRTVLDYIYTYLEEYNKEANYKYILGKTFGGPVLFSNSSLNITDDVLKGLNEYFADNK